MNETSDSQHPDVPSEETAGGSTTGPSTPEGQEAIAPASEVAVTQDPALTLAQSRLAGSVRCLNCGTDLEGPFCYYCGQPDRNFMRFFPALLREVLTEFLEFDSRFARTMKPLLFKPGKLTRDFLEGRRFRYTPPLRLYLFSSIAFFLLAAFLSSDAIRTSIDNGETIAGGVTISADSEEELEKVREALDKLPPELRDEVDLQLDGASVVPQDQEEFFNTNEININGEPWHAVDNPVQFSWLPQRVNDWLNEEIGRSPEKAKRINEDPRLIVREVFDILPITMFVLLPVVALIFKFWYLFSGRYYIEHLILALHNHAFLYVILIMALVLEALEAYAGERNMRTLEQAMFWSNLVLVVWIPVYLIGSLKRVYQQGWFLTLCKGFVVGISHFIVLITTTALVGMLSFLMV